MTFLLNLLLKQLPYLASAIAGAGISGMLRGGDETSGVAGRRRRRRMLTARDKEDLAFVEAVMGRNAAAKVLNIRVAALR